MARVSRSESVVREPVAVRADDESTQAQAQEQAQVRVAALRARYGGMDGESLLEALLRDELSGEVAATSSFGAESAVLLDMIASIDPSTPIIFLDTGKLFEETYNYVSTLTSHLGLQRVQVQRPAPERLLSLDPQGDLWQRDADMCCHIRKVEPLLRAFGDGRYQTWITGRKRYHGDLRLHLQTFEAVDGLIKVNPLAGWSLERIRSRFESRGLPLHPLVAQGYPSIGCHHCTHRAEAGDDPRAGRWASLQKTECGIHRASWMNK